MTPKGRAGKRGQIYLRKILAEVVDDRWHGRIKGDFLTGMIDALRKQFPEDEARALSVDNAATFYLAGHETTANALGWTLFLLAAQPELQEELAAEAQAALSDGQDDVAERTPRLRLFLSESLRLYPPVPRFDRQAIGHDRLGEHGVEPGDIVSIWPWILHRHRKLWDDPDAFDIDRFAGKGRAAPLSISAVRRRAANLRRRPVRHDRSADHPGPLAQPVAVRRNRPSGRGRGNGDAPTQGRTAAKAGAPLGRRRHQPLIVLGLLARLACPPPDDDAGDRQQRRNDAAERR